MDIKNSDNALSAKYISVLAGISYLANKTKTGSRTAPEDMSSVINAFATDFEDGLFDGEGSDGKSISVGTGAGQVTFSGAPLTDVLLPAITNYVKKAENFRSASPALPVRHSLLLRSLLRFNLLTMLRFFLHPMQFPDFPSAEQSAD